MVRSNNSLRRPPAPARVEGGSGSSTTPGRFGCAVPGCRKVFQRKEHLTRHLKSHDAEPQYVCHICGRRYARSDVLKRHIEFHPQYYKSRRGFVACARCRENKIKCDEDEPCRPCARKGQRCVRGSDDRPSDEDEDEDETLPEASRNSFSPSLGRVDGLRGPTLDEYFPKDSANVQRCIDVYFTRVHPIWPLLQPATVTQAESPTLLIASIVMLTSWLEEYLDHWELLPLALEEIAERQNDLNLPLPILQAMALCLVYTVCRLGEEGMAPKAVRLHNALVVACRFAGVIAPQRGILYASSYAITEQEDEEQRHRLAFAVLRIDAYLSAILDFPPLLRHQELSMPLSQSTWWSNVASEEERHRLMDNEPALRRKTSFGLRVHDLFGMPRPNALAPPWTKMDYHFILCAIQSGAWEASHQALRTVPDDLHARTHSEDPRHVWREYLSAWASGLQNDCQVSPIFPLRKEYFTSASPGDDIAPQTLLLWHMTSLKLQAPPDLWALRGRYYKLQPAGASPERRLQQSLRSWQASRLARVAVWHSAQIARIATGELALRREDAGDRLGLNPLLAPALLMGAAVAGAYAYHVRGCPLCTGRGPVDLVHVFGAPNDCERLARWLDDPACLLASWGVSVFTGFPLCRCRTRALSEWFRDALPRDGRAEAALAMFLDELETSEQLA